MRELLRWSLALATPLSLGAQSAAFEGNISGGPVQDESQGRWAAVRGRAVEVGIGTPAEGVAIGARGHTAFTGIDGTYCVELPAAGWEFVSAVPENEWKVAREAYMNLTPGSVLELDFRADGVRRIPEVDYVNGTVSAGPTGKRILGAQIVLMYAGNWTPPPLAISRRDGTFGGYLGPLGPGDYDIVVDAAGYRQARESLHFNGTGNEDRRVDFHLDPDPAAEMPPGSLCATSPKGDPPTPSGPSGVPTGIVAVIAVVAAAGAGAVGLLIGRSLAKRPVPNGPAGREPLP
jgi:hypothetical protein